ncbi:MAG: hypothetical protein KF865_04180 [Bdellovibrionaceae bacterium]|nr:hypothetical protein [Pseudobdellovibrionaceae bacterium]
MKNALLLLVSLSLVAASAGATSLLEQNAESAVLKRLREELKIDDATRALRIEKLEVKALGEKRELVTASFEAGPAGRFRLLLQGPKDFLKSTAPRAVLFISAGFYSGTRHLELLSGDDDQILIGFEYSDDTKGLIERPEQFARTVVQVPARLMLSLRWAQRQPWADPSRFHIMGISLGTLYLPVTLRMLQAEGFDFTSYISAFGGVGIRHPLYEVLRLSFGANESRLLTELISAVTTPYEPMWYLPQLTGRKLIIHGGRDAVFRDSSRKDLDRLASGPKMTCTLIGGVHIDLWKEKEVNATVKILRAWLKSETGPFSFPQIEDKGVDCVTSTL